VTVLAAVEDPDGRRVELTAERWEAHVLVEHPEMAPYSGVVMATIAQPDDREHDPAPGRERYWRQDIGGPARWMFVVVDFDVEPAEVVNCLRKDRRPARLTST